MDKAKIRQELEGRIKEVESITQVSELILKLYELHRIADALEIIASRLGPKYFVPDPVQKEIGD